MADNQIDGEKYQEIQKTKTNRTLWIILAVIAVVIICCCVLALVGSFLYIPSWYNQFNF